MQNEIEKIAERYERRKAVVGGRYARFNPEVIAGTQERQRALVSLLKAHGIADLAGVDVLEIGCGSGSNLQELLLLGAEPEHLVGNELLPERLEQARHVLPQAVRLFPGDASALPFEEASFDIVYQSTVFSSILDDALQCRIAEAMWRWIRPGGGYFGTTSRSITPPILMCVVCRSSGCVNYFRRGASVSAGSRWHRRFRAGLCEFIQ